MASKQQSFDWYSRFSRDHSPEAAAASDKLAAAGTESRGVVNTRAEVVDFILDLVGYTTDKPLFQNRILEPSFGSGSFLLAIVERLMAAWQSGKWQIGSTLNDLSEAIQAIELHRETFHSTHHVLVDLLEQKGLTTKIATTLADRWLAQGDFLLMPIDAQFDFVVGNPPYVRQEMIPAALLTQYRSRYKTMYDRADLYIPFIERSLSLLSDEGCLGFICSDRWMKNRYGGPLRNLVAQEYHLKIYVDMVDTPAFHSEVSAYPAITIISREAPGPTRIAHRPDITPKTLRTLADLMLADPLPRDDSVREVDRVAVGPEPWLLESLDQISLLRRLEKQFPGLEKAGCRVGIGVATGADEAFIRNYEQLDVEPDRKLPLVTTKDILSGEVRWGGMGVINPFREDGGLVDLRDYPRLGKYLQARRDIIAARHVAKKSPANWYRTIDRITPTLAKRQKLLIPDIKGKANVVFENGVLYPHHNLYYVTSETWDLRALQAVLLSDITSLFVASYSTKMRGGYLRFQAQYLRRIHIPLWLDVPAILQKELMEAGSRLDVRACNQAVFKLYGLSREERSSLGGNGE